MARQPCSINITIKYVPLPPDRVWRWKEAMRLIAKYMVLAAAERATTTK